MRVFNEFTRRFCSKNLVTRCITNIYDDYIEFGYYPRGTTDLMPILFNYSKSPDHDECDVIQIVNNENNLKKLVFSNLSGYYIIPFQFSEKLLFRHINIKGRGNFPYSFRRYYEALESFNIFDGKQVAVNNIEYNLSKYLKYTFGLEFETSCGYIPENLCFRDGLIPLRDGSIGGLEYSTVVLDGNKGLNLLKQQTDTLNKHTFYNKECALHIHLGGFPVNEKYIFTLYCICVCLERNLIEFIPRYSFKTSLYKKTEKDYCNELPRVGTFSQLYQYIAEKKYNGSLIEPHPHDIERNHKWDCHSRYVWCNLLNMVCFDKCKTVEFRFLRPTFNFNKIYLWLAIFNGILLYAEKQTKKLESKSDERIINSIYESKLTLSSIIHDVYPESFAKNIDLGLDKLRVVVENQSNNEDYCGKDTFFDDEIFTDIF